MTEDLLKRVSNKDRKAQHEFYKLYSVRLFRLVYRYVSNEQDAGSIVNSAFYKIFNNIGDFIYTDQSGMLGWMKKITINEALMFLRQKITYTGISDEIIKDLRITEIPEDNLVLEDYYNLIRGLPEDLRTVFNMYAIEGYNHNEIALHLNISESSSRVYLMRARKLLQDYLTKTDYHGEEHTRQSLQRED